MRYFDLHCDTMAACMLQKKGLYDNDLHISIRKAESIDWYVQCYAAFVPDSVRGEAAFAYFMDIAGKFQEEIERNQATVAALVKPGDLTGSKLNTAPMGAIFTVENGAALGGDLRNLEKLEQLGVRMMTLTWNGENELGTGILSESKTGITDFGIAALKEMERRNIVVDVSHASEHLFFDVCGYADRPFVASHSNAKSICENKRNLTDEQFMMIKERRGLVGLNFYKAFLCDREEKACMTDVLRHAEHFLALGGESILAMGSDFDGADMPPDLHGIHTVPELYELFLRHNYPESLVEQLFFSNAYKFFERNNLL